MSDRARGFCEYSYEPSGAIKGIAECLKRGSTHWSEWIGLSAGQSVWFHVLKTVKRNNSGFWELTLFSLETALRSGEPYRIHLQDRRVGHAKNQ
jgi:hypothetical protein